MKKRFQNILAITGISSILVFCGIITAMSNGEANKQFTASPTIHESNGTTEIIKNANQKSKPKPKLQPEQFHTKPNILMIAYC